MNLTGKNTLRTADLSDNRPRAFDIVPDADTLAALAAELDVSALRKLRFRGTIEPHGSRDWLLKARLGATVIQPCVVTLAPVTTRIEETVRRLYSPDATEPEGEEIEMPEDDGMEILPPVIDLDAVLSEALALAIPEFPRAGDVELGAALFSPEGAEPLTDEAARPFAGLAALRDRLGESGDD